MFRYASFLPASNIYEVNIRQFTAEGTFEAFQNHIPRLKKMGVEILWLMPVHPIGQINRKGLLGSYYSIQNFEDINPEFGTKVQFRNLIETAHQSGMKIIMDWVANHAAWDNVWTKDHPEYFCRNDKGEFVSPYDWTDVIQIDHQNPEQQKRMTEAMAYWVKEFNIDGFRADLAHLTPLSFWINARNTLQNTKPDLIWLAETEEASYHEAFDISFTWNWMHVSENYIKHQLPEEDFKEAIKKNTADFQEKALRLYFISNHDENSWNGTEFEKYGHFAEAVYVCCCTLPASVPLLYSGQEIPNTKRLAFFEKDIIESNKQYVLEKFYAILFSLRKWHPVFTNDDRSLRFVSSAERIIAFVRDDQQQPLIVILNFSDQYYDGEITLEDLNGNYVELFTGDEMNINGRLSLSIPSGGYKIL